MDLTEKDISSVYKYFKKSALAAFKDDKIELSLTNIEFCAKLAYHFNNLYADPELEQILIDNAKKIANIHDEIIPINSRYVLIDTNGSDNHGLTQQYIRALISAQVEFAYIYEDTDLTRIKIILEELRSYPKATFYYFDQNYSSIERIQRIMTFLQDYRPGKYLMHIMPWDIVAVAISGLLKGVTRYNINATDHAFWLGATCIDYCIEFRSYGYTVSVERRNLKPHQLLQLPYYPIINKIPFKGFPATIPTDSVKIFSGGSYYKMYGENEQYFKIVKQILTDNPKAVLLFAGNGYIDKFEEFIKKNNLSQRVYLLGNRSDIYQVFEECDIYLSTYPITGALMAQYAAICGKPILSYSDIELPINFLEGIVCHQKEINITYSDLTPFYVYANKLCSNKEFRDGEGLALKECVISPEVFNSELNYLLLNNQSKRVMHKEDINYKRFFDVYLEVENRFNPSMQKAIAIKLKLKTSLLFPKIFINVIFIAAGMFVKSARKIIKI